ncbi:MAG: hypothetical protein JWL99_4515 [Streptomyces oryziradicis]|nr:hypothetical protein [Actinacidiphila oryziradicis]
MSFPSLPSGSTATTSSAHSSTSTATPPDEDHDSWANAQVSDVWDFGSSQGRPRPFSSITASRPLARYRPTLLGVHGQDFSCQRNDESPQPLGVQPHVLVRDVGVRIAAGELQALVEPGGPRAHLVAVRNPDQPVRFEVLPPPRDVECCPKPGRYEQAVFAYRSPFERGTLVRTRAGGNLPANQSRSRRSSDAASIPRDVRAGSRNAGCRSLARGSPFAWPRDTGRGGVGSIERGSERWPRGAASPPPGRRSLPIGHRSTTTRQRF